MGEQVLNVVHVAGRGKGKRRVVESMPNLPKFLNSSPYPGTFNVVFEYPLCVDASFMLDNDNIRVGIPAKINGVPCIAYRFKGAPLHVFELISEIKLLERLPNVDSVLELSFAESYIREPSWFRRLIWSVYYKSDPKKYYDDKRFKRFWFRDSLHKLATQTKF